MDANEFLNSKGLIYTRELININDERINLIELLNEYKALSQHDVSICTCGTEEYSENEPRIDGLTYCGKCDKPY